MKILITGAAGFIGAHLFNYLELNFNVFGLDSGKSGDWSRLLNPNKVYKADLSKLNEPEMTQMLKDVDILIHLAAEKHNSTMGQSTSLLNSNVIGTERLFRIACENGVKKIIFSSSLYAYGKNGPNMTKVTDPINPKTLYGISKQTGENILQFYGNKYGVQWHAPRFFFIYGPHQFANGGYKSVIIKNFESLKRENSVTIVGDGSQVLDYVFIEDLVDALIRMIQLDKSTEFTNISTGVGTSITELIGIISKFKSNSKIYFEPKDWTHGTYRVGDFSKLKELTGWAPRTNIEEGIERTWAWFKGI